MGWATCRFWFQLPAELQMKGCKVFRKSFPQNCSLQLCFPCPSGEEHLTGKAICLGTANVSLGSWGHIPVEGGGEAEGLGKNQASEQLEMQ